MEQLVMMVLQTCQNYAEKSSETHLTEYEMLMYERMCCYITSFCTLQQLFVRKQICETECETLQVEAQHKEWLKANKPEDE